MHYRNQVGRQRSGELPQFPGARLRNLQPMRVERLPGEKHGVISHGGKFASGYLRNPSAVQAIAQDGLTREGEMHENLVRPPRLIAASRCQAYTALSEPLLRYSELSIVACPDGSCVS